MPLCAVIDESGLQAGLDAGDFALVYAGLFLAVGGDLDIQVVQVLSIHHGDAQLLGLGRVNKHPFHCHRLWFVLEAGRCGASSSMDAPHTGQRARGRAERGKIGR